MKRERSTETGAILRLVKDGPAMHFQPIVDLEGGRRTAVEALARFPASEPRAWFERAAKVGLSVELELACVRSALAHLDRLPGDVLLSINASAQTAATDEFAELIAGVEHRIIIELTEHVPIEDYRQLKQRLGLYRERGARIAVDDLGAGYASLRHLLRLDPDIVKLDVSLTRELETDPRAQALTAALVELGALVGASVTAEGIETESELALLRGLGVREGQGYYLGSPDELEPPG
jgi:EAL domain-containing protein (putative c-di-GMP-specific phosphodiesterase class I)